MYEAANLKIDFLNKVLPKIKSEGNKSDREFRIFVSRDDVQDDPQYPKTNSSDRIKPLPIVIGNACSEKHYIELAYNDALISTVSCYE